MKWLSNRYAYYLVIFVIVVSILLQLAWLSQLFTAQKVQAKRDLESCVGSAAQMSTYISLASNHKVGTNFRNFFLSPEWLEFKQAYNNMRFNHVGSRFNSEIAGDSTFVDISLRIFNGRPPTIRRGHLTRYDPGMTLAQEQLSDRADLKRMDSVVAQRISQLGVQLNTQKVIYGFDDRHMIDKYNPIELKEADFTSQQYSYNLRFLTMYQLVVPSLNKLVFYRMRYYLASSIFMLLLTIAVFIFILRLMRNQRLYTQARVSFTSNMTHELKTPVATVSIALESIIENHMENDPEGLRSYLEISRSELKRLNLMIDKVLNLEQFDSEQVRMREELFDVQQGLEQVISSMKLQFENSNAELIWYPIDIPFFISGDPVHLTNVFYNIIENALKYGGKNVKLEISCTLKDEEVQISFKDNGPGIPDEYHTQIFDRFSRVPAKTVDVHNIKGSGLGLNYVKQVVEKQSGHIKLQSKPGQGSVFTLIFPIGK